MKRAEIIALVVAVSMTLTACGKKTEVKTTAGGDKSSIEVSKSEVDNKVNVDAEVKNKPDSTSEPTPSDKNIQENSSKESQPTNTPAPTPTPQPATPTPQPQQVVKNKVIVIDPGHANRSNLETEPNSPGSTVMKIKDGGGAQGVATRTPEYLVNMEVSKRLKTLLEQKGFTVVMTKTDNSVSLGNVERAEIGNKANATLVIRIHADSSDSSSATGASMLVPDVVNDNTKAIYNESKRCGQIVLNTLTSQIGMKNRGLIFSKDMTGFNWSKVPVILVEMGFLSNPDEDKLLSSAPYQDKLAKGLADGIGEAFK